MVKPDLEGWIQLSKFNTLYDYPKLNTIRCWKSRNIKGFNEAGIIKNVFGRQFINVEKLFRWGGLDKCI